MKFDPKALSGSLARRGVEALTIVLASMLVTSLPSEAQRRNAAPPSSETAPRDDLEPSPEVGVLEEEEILLVEPARLDWTTPPGAFESDLMRRNANPFYEIQRQRVTEADLRQAKIRDADDAWNALDEFISIQLGRKKAARLESVEEIDAFLERIAEAIQRDLEIGGQGLRLAGLLRTLRAELLAEWRERNADSPAVLGHLSALEASGGRTRPEARDPLIAQLLREDGPIRATERASFILSGDADEIPRLVAALPSQIQRDVRSQGVAIVRDLQLRGVEVAGLGEKLGALYGDEGPSAFGASR